MTSVTHPQQPEADDFRSMQEDKKRRMRPAATKIVEMLPTQVAEADGESELSKYAIKAWVKTDDGQETQMEVVQLNIAERVLAQHDQARDAQKLAAVLKGRPEKMTNNVGFTFGDAKLPLTQFQVGFNQAIDQYDAVVRGVLGVKGKDGDR